MKNITLQELLFADDTVLVAETEEKDIVLKQRKHRIKLNKQVLEQISSYNYLGTNVRVRKNR